MNDEKVVITLTPLPDGRWLARFDDPYAEAAGGSKDAAVHNLLKEVTLDG